MPKDYDEALKAGLISYQLLYSYGIALQAFDMWEEAVEKLKKASELDDTNFSVHYALSLSYLKTDSKEDAYRELKRTLELNPSHTISLYNLGQLYLKDGKYDEAIELYKKAISADAKLTHVYFNIANAYHLKGDMQKAVKYWEKTVEYDKSNTGALLNLANAYSSMGDGALALRKARSAYMTDKKNPDIIMAYGIILLRENSVYDAREKFEEALEIKPDLMVARFALIECLIKTNKPKEAMSELEKYKEEHGSKKEFMMLNLLAYLKIEEMEQNDYLIDQITGICDKILCTCGEDAWVQKVKEEYQKKHDNKDSEG